MVSIEVAVVMMVVSGGAHLFMGSHGMQVIIVVVSLSVDTFVAIVVFTNCFSKLALIPFGLTSCCHRTLNKN